MKHYLDLTQWNRRDHFMFFRQFEEPFFWITASVDVSHAYDISKKNELSFFLYYIHCALNAANQPENFKYRIENEQVVVYDQVNASPTINRPDGTMVSLICSTTSIKMISCLQPKRK